MLSGDSKVMKHPNLQKILEIIKDYLTSQYQDQLKAIILYGSQAREDSHEFSDIDLLIVLDGAINPYQEIDRTSDFIAQISLEHDIVISRHFISQQKFQSYDNPFLHNIKQEGIQL